VEQARTSAAGCGALRCVLDRGESMVASTGLGLAVVLLIAVAASGWWVAHTQQQSDRAEAREQLQLVATLFSNSVESMLKAGDVSALRRAVAQTAIDHELTHLRVLLPDGQIIADAAPGKITTLTLPDAWPTSNRTVDTASAPVDASMHVVTWSQIIRVPGRGPVQLQIGADLSQPWWSNWEPVAGIGAIGAFALGALFIIYHRLRVRVRAMGAVRDALLAVQRGEPTSTALAVRSDDGPESEAWNALLDELERRRRDAAAEQAHQMLGSGRCGTAGLDGACDVMSQGIVLIDAQMCVKYANGAAAVFLRARRDDLIDQEIGQHLPEADLIAAVRGAATGAVRKRATFEVEREDEEGGKGQLRFSVRPVRKDDSAAAMIVIEDITQQRVAEAARHAFVAQATHELRTPLTNIRLYVETALDEGENDATLRAECLNVINTESRRLERIVGDMLSVAEIEAGSLRIKRDDVRIAQVFEQLEGDYRAQAKSKDIDLTFKVPPKMPVLQGDREKIILALHNLVGNALKYTPQGGKVTVNVDADDEQMTVEVDDSGIGISEEDARHIFEKFYRANDKRLTEITGSGLGLALAREVVRLHGGDIEVQSELNKGSKFTMTLPTVAKAA